VVQHVPGGEGRRRRRDVVVQLAVLERQEAHRRSRFRPRQVGELGRPFQPPGDRGGKNGRVHPAQRKAAVHRRSHDKRRGQDLSHGPERQHAPRAPVPVVGDGVEVDDGAQPQAMVGKERGQGRRGRPRPGRGVFLVRHREEQEIALQPAGPRETGHRREPGREPRLHVEKPPPGKEAAGLQIVADARLARAGRRIRHARRERGGERRGVARQGLQVAVVLGRHGIEMPGQEDRLLPAAPHQKGHAVPGVIGRDGKGPDGWPGAEAVEAAEVVGEPVRETGLVRGSGHAGLARHRDRKVAAELCQVLGHWPFRFRAAETAEWHPARVGGKGPRRARRLAAADRAVLNSPRERGRDNRAATWQSGTGRDGKGTEWDVREVAFWRC
jgi:hypothetical protein